MKRPIELRRVRDFGQVINDSFTFLKENFRPLFTALFIICSFFLVLGTITSVFTYLKMSAMYSGDFENIQNGRYDYLISAAINVISLLAAQACIHLVTLCYISVYIQKNNVKPTFAEVWGYFKYYFFRVFGSSILITIMTMVGLLLCIIPGIYISPIFYLIIPIIVIENSSFGYAFNTAFRLIKENWWPTFGVIFVMGLIVGFANSFAGYPITIISMGGRFLSLKSFTVPLIVFFSLLRSVLMLSYSLPAIAISLCYFNLTEKKDGLGLLGRIEKFGSNLPDGSNLPTEEY
ncbi:MAG: hypothetical protein ABIN13_12995 [Mucilaginibacter sp.]